MVNMVLLVSHLDSIGTISASLQWKTQFQGNFLKDYLTVSSKIFFKSICMESDFCGKLVSSFVRQVQYMY